MSSFWIVDTKCKVLPESSMPQDGSKYYYGRSVVPAAFKEHAIEQLTHELEADHILVETVLNAVNYEDTQWEEDDRFEVKNSLEESKISNEIELGCFISEESMRED